uniref:Uncharacterized protein n=1 Tax=Rhizophora mucronata TaxID=61149 RepID=A0A2P2JBD7_RHIMU
MQGTISSTMTCQDLLWTLMKNAVILPICICLTNLTLVAQDLV